VESRSVAAAIRFSASTFIAFSNPANSPCALRQDVDIPLPLFRAQKVVRSIFNALSTVAPKIGNKTVAVSLTDRRFAATFFARYFRTKP
jgi:hypothetical protein